LGQLAEEHGNKMVPGTKSLAIAFSPMLLDQMMKLPAT